MNEQLLLRVMRTDAITGVEVNSDTQRREGLQILDYSTIRTQGYGAACVLICINK